MKYKYAVGDKVVLRNDPDLRGLESSEVTIDSQEVSVGMPCYRVTATDGSGLSSVVWEGYISGASAGSERPAILEVMTQPQIIRSGVGTVVSDEDGKIWVKIAGGKWAGGTKDDLQILTSKGLWDKFMSLELRKEGL